MGNCPFTFCHPFRILGSRRRTHYLILIEYHMTTLPTPPEIKNKILAALKSGTSIGDLAKEYHLPEDTIKGWLPKDTQKAPTGTAELTRLRREIQQLKEILGSILLERELAKRNPTRP